jgi:TonB-linked SusC/RagA family outer membrane protein
MLKKFVATMICCAFILAPALAFSQEAAVVSGQVTDELGEPLPGANILIPSLNIGAASDKKGMFRFLVPSSMVKGQEVNLTVRYIGYKSQTAVIQLTPSANISQNFELKPDVLEMEEVVVTGMGIGVQKEKLGVTIGKVKTQEIVDSDEANFVSALHGKVANVEITSSSGEPGAATYIRIRGANTIRGGTQPLMVVDGTPINNQMIFGGNSTGGHGGTTPSNRASDINPEDIESIAILKGAAASAIYGSRANNGVVLITTKSGKFGGPKMSYKVVYSFDKVTNLPELQTRYGQGVNGDAYTGNIPWSWGPKLDSSTPTFDHAGELFETGNVFENNLTLSGGSESTTYYLSLSRYNQDGTIKGKNSDYQRTAVRVKASQRIGENVNLIGNIAFSDVSMDRIQRGSNVSGLLLGALRTPPNFNNDPYLNEFGFHRSYRFPDRTTMVGSRGYDNPFFVINEHLNPSEVGRAFGNIRLEIDPLDWVNVSYTLGHDYSNDERRTVLPIGSSDKPEGRIIREKFNYQETDGKLTITATRRFKPADLVVNFLAGHEINQRKYNNFTTIGDGISVAGFNQLDNTTSWSPNEFEWTIRDEGYFGQAMFDLWDQLYLSAAIRNDGSSTFGESEKRHWYPKFSGAWEFTALDQLSGISKWLSFGKIRAAYGESGRQPGVYQTITAFTTGGYGAGWGVFLDGTAFGYGGFFSSWSQGNADIKPERAKETEFGLDLAFYNNRFGVNVTRYIQKTEDVILSLPVPPSTGYGETLKNAAAIENKGWEIDIDLQPIRLRDFKWNLGFVYGKNDNVVTDLAGAEFVGLGGFVSAAAYAVEGEPYGVLRGEDFIRFGRGSTVKENGQVVDIDSKYAGQWSEGDLYIAEDSFPLLDPQERIIGDPNPDWTGSIRSTFTLFNKLRISGLLDIKQGGDVWNGTRGALRFFGTHKDTDVQYIDDNGQEQRGERYVFSGVGPGAGQEVIRDQDSWYGFGLGSGFTGPSSQFVEDASYVKLREVSVSYKLNHPKIKQWTGLSDIDIRVSGRNLVTWTDYTGIDPETNLFGSLNRQGFDYFNNPQTRSYVLTLRFNY